MAEAIALTCGLLASVYACALFRMSIKLLREMREISAELHRATLRINNLLGDFDENAPFIEAVTKAMKK